jgi:hypothetical protein
LRSLSRARGPALPWCLRSVAARAILEDEGVVEADALDQRARGGVVFIGLAGETDDDVGGQRNVRAGGAKLFPSV